MKTFLSVHQRGVLFLISLAVDLVEILATVVRSSGRFAGSKGIGESELLAAVKASYALWGR